MLILGLNDANSAAAIIRDGQLIAAAREERFNRIKHSDAFPLDALEYCLQEAGAEIKDLDSVAFAWNPGHELEPLYHSAAVREHHQFLHWVPNNLLSKVKGHKSEKRIARIYQELQLPDAEMNIHFLPHHLCHAAASFFISPYEEAAVITADAYGDDISMQIHHGKGNNLRVLSTTKFPHSPGSVYAAITQYLGFRPNMDEWKVMGLAPLGEPTLVDKFREIFRFDEAKGQLRVDLDYFSYYLWSPRRYSDLFEETFGPERHYHDPIEKRHRDLARSFQQVVEEVTLACVAWAKKATSSKNLCLSGGSAMNSKANGRIMSEAGLDNLWVQSSADDGGACLGACYYLWNQMLSKPRDFVYEHDYWGPGFSNEEIKKALDTSLLTYRLAEDAAQEAAEFISQGKILGWFQGRMEFGQRALGNRSILADPRDPAMKDRINALVKHREGFRPFAPSILEEAMGEFFEVDYPVPFMQKIYQIRPEKRELIPAVTHVDGSGRLQSVSKRQNALYWDLINKFRGLTGVPVVLNTSFNDNNEPIVTTPRDAIKCFYGTGMEVLFLGDYIVEK